MAAKHVGLGRGLGALIQEAPKKAAPVQPAAAVLVPIDRIRTGTWQPRKRFQPEAMEELVRSIRERGVLQPLLVRQSSDGSLELIAGERRLRAATAAGLREVPVKTIEVDDRGALELALIENLQREDLDPIEEAEGYHSLAEKFSLTQEEIAEKVGKARASVANALRLLTLSDRVRESVRSGRLSVGHAKVLLGVAPAEEQDKLAERVVREDLSVRALERAVEALRRAPRKPRAFKSDLPAEHARFLEERMQQKFGTAVSIYPSRTLANGKKAKGQITIDYYSNDDLDRLMLLIGVSDDF